MSSFFLVFLMTFVSQAQMSLGFIEDPSPLIPPAVQQAREKIFKISVPYYYTVPEKDYTAYLQLPQLSEEAKNILTLCQERKEPTCTTPITKIQGTAFLDKSPQYIWTNCHIVSEWMAFAAQNQTFSTSNDAYSFFRNKPIPITLSTTTNNVTYSSQESSYIVVYATDRSNGQLLPRCRAYDDLVKIQLSRPLAENGLPWGRIQHRDPLFMGGFPKATESRLPYGVLDANGTQFYWSQGLYLNKKNADSIEYLSSKPHLDFALSGPYLETSTADGVEGMSGAPVLNQLGEVVGIYKGYLPLSDEERDVPFISLFISTSGMRYIEVLSNY